MEVGSSSDALPLILCDRMCLLCPKMPPLGAQGTPAPSKPQAAVTDCHLVVTGWRVALTHEVPAKGEKNKPNFFLPKPSFFCTGEISQPGSGQRDSSEPQRQTNSAAARPHYGLILGRQAGKSSLSRKQVDRNITLSGLPALQPPACTCPNSLVPCNT